MGQPRATLFKGPLAALVAVTAAYWYWESRAEGNIRVDLLLIYPLLTAVYFACLWPRFRWWSLAMTAALMALNVYYFTISYKLFGKNIG